MKPKLNSAVSVVRVNEKILEFFKSNTRQQVRIKVDSDLILKIVCDLDGHKDIREIAEKYNVSEAELVGLFSFLAQKGILNAVDPAIDFKEYEKFRRVINFLGDFSTSHEHLVKMWNDLQSACVLIVGLGAVGSWVACNLSQSGIEKFILMDPDAVEKSNLHRQFGYTETDIGVKKIDVLEKRLKEYNPNVCVKKSYDFLDGEVLSRFDGDHIDLIINCADKPTVDMTSTWIGEYAMKRQIPHIVGGGYNLHLSLVGQTIIPGQTACVKCFEKTLEEENKIDRSRVKKLAVKNRKVGSFGPMCSLIASMIGMEAIKILSKCCRPANINRRGEFDIYSMDVSYKEYNKRLDCDWCGVNGLYSDAKYPRE